MEEAASVFQPLRADDPRLVGGYRLAARLGAGGMGRVYLSHTPGGRPVALKVVRPELADDPVFRKRFRREIGAARRVKGAYTAELIDADADGVLPWLATLYVPGPSLAEVVARHGPLPVPAVLWMLAGVAEALEAIHGEGIVHRDLKPSNVLLAPDGPRVIDFGVSLAADATSHTVTGAVIGTPTFMAPEQASGGDVTPATDVFALGQTAAFAALGEPLYGEGASAAGVLYRIVHDEPDLSGLPEPLRPLIARCLAADPEARPTPAEVVDRCRRLLGPDSDGGGAPAVWQELRGPDVPIPAPVAHPTPVSTQALFAPPQPAGPAGLARPTIPGGQRDRRRRTALITTVAVAAALLLVAGLVGTVVDVADRLFERRAAAASTSGPAASPGSSSPDVRASTPTPTPQRASSSPEPPEATLYPTLWLGIENSMDLTEPIQPMGRQDRKGDIRLNCEEGCMLKGRSSVMTLLPGKQRGTYATCRAALDRGARRDLPLAKASDGSSICVRLTTGDIALLVIQTKSTALPQLAFVTTELRIWRVAQG
ncbi:protein kinase domain-containing protein [Streptomyces tritici]|uniref:serine/threonine-protein kinase n=1 Tax=Streptomyces tritici TaxID=2054410 RepID=UPI003AF1C6FF